MPHTERDAFIHSIAWKIIRLDENDFSRMVKIKELISEAMVASALDSTLQFPEMDEDVIHDL